MTNSRRIVLSGLLLALAGVLSGLGNVTTPEEDTRAVGEFFNIFFYSFSAFIGIPSAVVFLYSTMSFLYPLWSQDD